VNLTNSYLKGTINNFLIIKNMVDIYSELRMRKYIHNDGNS